MTKYELMFIIDPALDEEKKNAAVEKVQNLISSNGELGETDVWGMRKLAYPIDKKTDGYYVVIEFQAETDFPKELDRRLRISDDVIRHMVVNKEAK
ncbi:small subunit ribosomal protein S6 [Eubacterium pyruvativorans]|jgi:small subunit ribosomal protein S6|uniref:Small ribosomal subunit protein bS6 n=1 Tax=Eubacterium pyruvativorans TaxID=155865 RepID=A0A1I7I5K2_9FIRM|nr:30S ribosomal protein S6 [Eubacterium pyruvativorans]HAT82533.1 30S ribosomal protein S6 [Eubacterium sp.]MCI5746371.1 30S ribosomal protein S6 [Eubacterium pyruvativorans]MDD6707501.1 30S ribosomal protein S6 [Eubacterium pyruvativorans]MDD7684563.1 30S ribosomal protein S6 [Eubacterium pyruvativorans]MDY4049895.1 30S ribosomal protein S6 [Eubacterium pyruvativorans]